MANALTALPDVFGGSKTFLGGVVSGRRGIWSGFNSSKTSAGINDPLNLMGGRTPPPPGPVPIVPLPDPDMQDAARKRAIATRRAGTGRASTIFSEPGTSTLGG